MEKDILGILGGMGPLATVDFMQKIILNTDASRDQEHVRVFACSATDIPDRTSAILNGGPDPFPRMLSALRQLEAAGVSRIAIPCNTAHHWYDALQAQSSVPIIHIADGVIEAVKKLAGVRPAVGLLATSGTLASGFFQRRFSDEGVTCLVPTIDAQAEVMRAIALVKAGNIDEAREMLSYQAEALIALGADFIIGACTEIPVALALSKVAAEKRFIDPTDILARVCITRSGGKLFDHPVSVTSVSLGEKPHGSPAAEPDEEGRDPLPWNTTPVRAQTTRDVLTGGLPG